MSLVGPGGVGKTRLALRLASEVRRGFRDGAWLVELAELKDPALVPNAVLASLELRDQTATEPLTLLLSYLRDQQLVLVIDNCEHLLGACGSLITQILGAAPEVRLVITSREPLSVQGEYVSPVAPFQLPDPNVVEPFERVEQNEAVALFTERARAASGRFELNHANQASVIELCRRLDGLPLAIELAAVRTRALSVDQILDRLSDRFRLLTGGAPAALPRHQTLQTTIDWSYGLLGETDRAILRRLSVFVGGFTLEAAEEICASAGGSSEEVFDSLCSLLDKSLVVKMDGGHLARYRLHETMRDYAVLKLRAAGEEGEARERYSRHYMSICERSIEEARYRLVEWLDWADAEIDNIRALLYRFLELHDYASGLALAGSLGWYWSAHATTEGVRWIEQFLSYEAGDPSTLAQAYMVRGLLASVQLDPAAAVTAGTRAARLAREAGRTRLEAESLAIASTAYAMNGDPARAAELAHDVEDLLESFDDPRAVCLVAYMQGWNALCGGDLERGRSLFLECARVFREMGDLYMLQASLSNLMATHFFGGDLEGAIAFLEEGLSIARRLDDRVTQSTLLCGLGCYAAAVGEAQRAAQLLGAGEKARVEVGAGAVGLVGTALAQAKETAESALGVARFTAEFKAGEQLRLVEALALALGESTAESGKASTTDSELLGKREAEVARLVADGLSNKEIGARLFISDRTVESHIRSVMNKLGFDSRAQIASWIASSPGR